MLPRWGDCPGDGLLVSMGNGAAVDKGIVLLRDRELYTVQPWTNEVELRAPRFSAMLVFTERAEPLPVPPPLMKKMLRRR
jgi:hypothetical protein